MVGNLSADAKYEALRQQRDRMALRVLEAQALRLQREQAYLAYRPIEKKDPFPFLAREKRKDQELANTRQGQKGMDYPEVRKATPIARGVLDYFPDAIAAVAQLSHVGNEQHNPGEPMHWAREKSTDHADCIARHLIDRGKIDSDGQRHSAKVAWRALALLQLEIEAGR